MLEDNSEDCSNDVPVSATAPEPKNMPLIFGDDESDRPEGRSDDEPFQSGMSLTQSL